MKRKILIVFFLVSIFYAYSETKIGFSFNYANITEFSKPIINHSRLGGGFSLYTDADNKESLFGVRGFYFKTGFYHDITNFGGMVPTYYETEHILADRTLYSKQGQMISIPLRLGLWWDVSISSDINFIIASGVGFDILFGNIDVILTEKDDYYDLEKNNLYNGNYFTMDVFRPFIDFSMEHKLTTKTSFMYGLDLSLSAERVATLKASSVYLNKSINEKFNFKDSFEISPYIGVVIKLGDIKNKETLESPVFSHKTGVYPQGNMDISITNPNTKSDIAYRLFPYSPINYEEKFENYLQFSFNLGNQPIKINASVSKKDSISSSDSITVIPDLTEEQKRKSKTVITSENGSTMYEDYIITIKEDKIPFCESRSYYSTKDEESRSKGILYKGKFTLCLEDEPVTLKVITEYLKEDIILLTTETEQTFYPISEAEVKNREKLIITKASCSKPNSAGGVNLYVNFINTHKKTIKYLDVTAIPYNRVGDIVGCEIRNNSRFKGIFTGPYEPGQESDRGCFENAWYNNSIDHVEITDIIIEYMDGTFEYISGEDLKNMIDN